MSTESRLCLARRIETQEECSLDFLWHQGIRSNPLWPYDLDSFVPLSIHSCTPVRIHSTNISFCTTNLGSQWPSMAE